MGQQAIGWSGCRIADSLRLSQSCAHDVPIPTCLPILSGQPTDATLRADGWGVLLFVVRALGVWGESIGFKEQAIRCAM